MESTQPKYVKGSCVHCAGHFEFDEACAGTKVECPHCGKETQLFSISIRIDGQMAAPSRPPQPAPAPQTSHTTEAVPGQPRYFSGGPVQLGDRVQYKGSFATVVVISNGDYCQCAAGYDEYRGQEAGVRICDDDGETTLVNEDDEQLALVHH